MSKYEPLWAYVRENCDGNLKLTFSQAEAILGFPIDHSFLTFKKELLQFGFRAGKISMKEETVMFERTE